MTTILELMTAALIKMYESFGEAVTIESVGATAIFNFGKGEGYKGSDALGHDATMRVRISEIAEINAGDSIMRGAETWQVIDGDKSIDGLEWIALVSKITR